MRDRLLAFEGSKVLLAYGNQVVLVDQQSKEAKVLQVVHPPSKGGKGAPADPNPDAVEAVALSPRAPLAVGVYRNKTMALWSTVDGSLVAQRVLPKKPTSVVFAPSPVAGELIVTSDKVAEVRAYPATDAMARESALLLGHTGSIITSMDLRGDGALLATADRDEKVRLSSFPHTCLTQGFGTGHSKYVSVVRFVGSGGDHVLSGGGGGQLFLWQAPSGAEQASTIISDDPQPAASSGGSSEEQAAEGEGPTVHLLAPGGPDLGLAVVALQGQARLRTVRLLPSLTPLANLDLPSPPLALHFSPADPGLLYVSVDEPAYLLAVRVDQDGRMVQVPDEDDEPLASLVRAFATQQAIKTEVKLEEFDGRGELVKTVLNRKFNDRDDGQPKQGDGWGGGKKEKRKREEEDAAAAQQAGAS